jgi:hypothetical protein
MCGALFKIFYRTFSTIPFPSSHTVQSFPPVSWPDWANSILFYKGRVKLYPFVCDGLSRCSGPVGCRSAGRSLLLCEAGMMKLPTL